MGKDLYELTNDLWIIRDNDTLRGQLKIDYPMGGIGIIIDRNAARKIIKEIREAAKWGKETTEIFDMDDNYSIFVKKKDYFKLIEYLHKSSELICYTPPPELNDIQIKILEILFDNEKSQTGFRLCSTSRAEIINKLGKSPSIISRNLKILQEKELAENFKGTWILTMNGREALFLLGLRKPPRMLNDIEFKILEYIYKNKTVDINMISKETGLEENEILTNIDKLKTEGFIQSIGREWILRRDGYDAYYYSNPDSLIRF